MKIRCSFADSWVDEEKKIVCFFGRQVSFNDEQFFVVKTFLHWYLDLYDETKKKKK